MKGLFKYFVGINEIDYHLSAQKYINTENMIFLNISYE